MKHGPSWAAAGVVTVGPLAWAQIIINGVRLAGAPASAGSDPIARMGNVQRKFELPLYTKTPLLVAPDLFVRGSVFPGNTRFLDVKVKKDLEHTNASSVHPVRFGTLDIECGAFQPRTVSKALGLNETIPRGFLGYDLAFYKLRRTYNTRLPVVGGFRHECIDMSGQSVHLCVCSAPADEYYGHFHRLALRNMHLDLHFLEIRAYSKLTGLLPELWGTQPMSETTRSYFSPEEAKFERSDTIMYEGEANETVACKAQEQQCTKTG